MSNEIREKDHEWVKTFHSNFDRMLALLKKLLEKRQPSAYSDELLTDKEVAYLLKVSRRTLQGNSYCVITGNYAIFVVEYKSL